MAGKGRDNLGKNCRALAKNAELSQNCQTELKPKNGD